MTDKEVMQSAMNENCPACGYYCLGNGGVYCIDKPTKVETTRACLAQPEYAESTKEKHDEFVAMRNKSF